MIGWAASRVLSVKICFEPWPEPKPLVWIFSSASTSATALPVLSSTAMRLANFPSRQPQQIISLKLSQPVKALLAAWTLTSPPPFMTNSVKESFIAVPHSGPL